MAIFGLKVGKFDLLLEIFVGKLIFYFENSNKRLTFASRKLNPNTRKQ